MEVIEPKGNFEVDGLTVFDDNQQLIRPVWTMGIVAAPTIAKVRNVYVNRHGYPAVLPLRTKVQGGVGWSELPMVSLSSSSAIAGTDYVGQMVELTGSGGFVLPEANSCLGLCLQDQEWFERQHQRHGTGWRNHGQYLR